MASRYGTFGATAVRGGVVGDRSSAGSCTELEAQPPPPCAATGGCRDLLALAQQFREGSLRAAALMADARAAMEHSNVLLARAWKGAEAMLDSPTLSHELALNEPVGPAGVMRSMKSLRNTRRFEPLDEWPLRSKPEDPHQHAGILGRLIERWDADKRTAEYLARAEDDQPLLLPETHERVPRVGPLVVAAAPAAVLLPACPRQPHRRLGVRGARRAAVEAFLGLPAGAAAARGGS